MTLLPGIGFRPSRQEVIPLKDDAIHRSTHLRELLRELNVKRGGQAALEEEDNERFLGNAAAASSLARALKAKVRFAAHSQTRTQSALIVTSFSVSSNLAQLPASSASERLQVYSCMKVTRSSSAETLSTGPRDLTLLG